MNLSKDSLQEPNTENSANGFSEEAKQLRFLEALLFASSEPISEEIIAQQLSEDSTKVKKLISDLQKTYSSRGINLSHIAQGWTFMTAPDLAEDLTVYRKVKRRLSRAALETLAIIAYHQPITRAEIEDIRGVALSRGTLDLLLEAAWIKTKGRRRTPGRPSTWVTTSAFLSHFALGSLDDLPNCEELKAGDILNSQGPLPGNNIESKTEPELFENHKED